MLVGGASTRLATADFTASARSFSRARASEPTRRNTTVSRYLGTSASAASKGSPPPLGGSPGSSVMSRVPGCGRSAAPRARPPARVGRCDPADDPRDASWRRSSRAPRSGRRRRRDLRSGPSARLLRNRAGARPPGSGRPVRRRCGPEGAGWRRRVRDRRVGGHECGRLVAHAGPRHSVRRSSGRRGSADRRPESPDVAVRDHREASDDHEVGSGRDERRCDGAQVRGGDQLGHRRSARSRSRGTQPEPRDASPGAAAPLWKRPLAVAGSPSSLARGEPTPGRRGSATCGDADARAKSYGRVPSMGSE